MSEWWICFAWSVDICKFTMYARINDTNDNSLSGR